MSVWNGLKRVLIYHRRRRYAGNGIEHRSSATGAMVDANPSIGPSGYLASQKKWMERVPDNSLKAQFDFSTLPAQSRNWPLWWEIVNTRGLNHNRSAAWLTDTKPKLDEQLPGLEILGSSVSGDTVYSYLFWLDGVLCLMWFGRREMTLHMAAEDDSLFKLVEDKFKVIFPVFEPVVGEEVRFEFWFCSPQGQGAQVQRLLAVPKWEEIKDNYGEPVQQEMERLTTDFKPGHGGQILLWQGPPGTGKTFAIRALAKEWVKWCDGAYVVDPEVFFNNANYMMSVMLESGEDYHTSMDDEEDKQPRWKLIILEDCGEMLSADAKSRSGQALSRLLNVADGLIGQGLNVLILITTNEEMATLHDAVSRPGRCASKIVFPKLSKDETAAWRERNSMAPLETPREMSLAELYGERDGFAKETEKEKQSLGFYTPPTSTGKRPIGFHTGQPLPGTVPASEAGWELGRPV